MRLWLLPFEIKKQFFLKSQLLYLYNPVYRQKSQSKK